MKGKLGIVLALILTLMLIPTQVSAGTSIMTAPGASFGNFGVVICDNTQYFAWADEISLADYYNYVPLRGKTLAEDVVATGGSYELFIPRGTVVTDLSGECVAHIFIKKSPYPNNWWVMGPNIMFSQPVTLYQNGEKVMSFTKIAFGVAH